MSLTSKPVLLNAQAMGASFESLPFHLGPKQRWLSIELSAPTGDHVGAITIKAGNNLANQENWPTVSFSKSDGTSTDSIPVSASAVLEEIVQLILQTAFFTIVYTRTSGGAAAGLTAVIATKHES